MSVFSIFKKEKLRHDLVFEVPRVTRFEAEALRALSKGEADEGQQTAALALIVKKFSRPHDVTYIPGSFDRTGFMSGRAYVGQQVLRLLNISISELPEE